VSRSRTRSSPNIGVWPRSSLVHVCVAEVCESGSCWSLPRRARLLVIGTEVIKFLLLEAGHVVRVGACRVRGMASAAGASGHHVCVHAPGCVCPGIKSLWYCSCNLVCM
jgi:hypothetical protein